MIPFVELKPNHTKIREWLEAGELLGIPTYLLLHLQHRGRLGEIFREEPLEFVLSLQERYSIQLPDESISRIQAITHAVLTPAFTHSPEGFLAIANSLCDGDPGLDEQDPVTLPEMYWAVWEVTQLIGDADYSDSVQRLIEEILNGEVEVDTPGEKMALWGYIYDQWATLFTQMTEGFGLEPKYVPTFDLENRQDMVLDAID